MRDSGSRYLGSNPSPAATLSAVRETDPPHIFGKVRENYPGTPIGHRTLNINKKSPFGRFFGRIG